MNTGTLRTVARVGGTVLLVGLVIPFAVASVPGVVGAEASYIVTSGSMSGPPQPDIRAGDVVIVGGVDAERISEGDIVTFERNSEERITHRVVGITRTEGTLQFRTKGDANDDADPQPVTPDQVTGQVLFVIPVIGHVMTFGATTYGFVALVVLPLGLLFLTEVWNATTTVRAQLAADAEPSAPGDRATSETPGTDTPTVSLDRGQLAWTAVALAPLSVGSGYAALRLQSAYTFTAAYATTGLLLLCSGVYVATGVLTDDDDSDPTAESGRARQPPPAGGAPRNRPDGDTPPDTRRERVDPPQGPAVSNRPTVYVDSPEELAEVAAEAGEWVVLDPSTGEQVVFLENRVVRYRDDDPDTPTREHRRTPTGDGGRRTTPAADTADGSSRPAQPPRPSADPVASGTDSDRTDTN